MCGTAVRRSCDRRCRGTAPPPSDDTVTIRLPAGAATPFQRPLHDPPPGSAGAGRPRLAAPHDIVPLDVAEVVSLLANAGLADAAEGAAKEEGGSAGQVRFGAEEDAHPVDQTVGMARAREDKAESSCESIVLLFLLLFRRWRTPCR
eukprot:TRINITY_DN17704_c0_g1_i1.p4 TRINITY_DN17704_c0_g1~~TRINITY_DN17704_c0_g1_i1.p4  ORF type:complete len:147 (+),score=15.62 TRINITY_DN17704_c0_g1_i1:187-627(+)